MTWSAALIVVGGVLALAAGVAYLFIRERRRADAAETEAAVERSKTLDIQAREARARAKEKYQPMTHDEIGREADALAERIRRDQESGSRKP